MRFSKFLVKVVLGFFWGYYLFPNSRIISVWTLFMRHSTSDRNIKLSQCFEKNEANIFIGIISSKTKLNTRVATTFETWAKRNPKVVVEVFANNNGTKDKQKDFVSTTLKNGAKVIQLPGVNDRDYPPLKKSFSMIKFMHDVYINDFDWFVRLDDDAYVDTTKLLTFLNGVNSSLPWYIGCAGFEQNKNNFLSKYENYCQGGPGVIMSRALLRKVGPHLGECLHSLFTEHEDIELGRCIHKTTGVKCVMGRESTELFFQNFDPGSYAANIEKIDPVHIKKGIIFHAFKDPSHQQSFHLSTLKQKIPNLINKISKLEPDLFLDAQHSNLLNTVKLGVPATAYNLENQTDAVLRWNAIVDRTVFVADKDPLSYPMRDELKMAVAAFINVSSRALETDSKLLKLINISPVESYHTFQSPFSVDFASYVIHEYSGSAIIRKSKRKIKSVIRTRQKFVNEAIFLREPTSHLNALLSELSNLRRRARETDSIAQLYQAENNQLLTANSTPVNFIVALSGRLENFIRFLYIFEETFIKRDKNINLYITYFPSEQSHSNMRAYLNLILEGASDQNEAEMAPIQDENEQWIKANISLLQEKYPHSKLKLLLTERGKPFSRGFGLQSAAAGVTDEKEILFFCDIDMTFLPEMLTHIRRNTILGKQVYYPTSFTQYHLDVVFARRQKPNNHFQYEDVNGYWRIYGYGILAIYKSDFDKTEGFDLSIKGWGSEDLRLADAIAKSGFTLFRSNEPALVHIYHHRTCEPSLPSQQHFDCVKSLAAHFGSYPFLYHLWKQRRI